MPKKQSEPEYLPPESQPEICEIKGHLPIMAAELSDLVVDYAVQFERLKDRVEEAMEVNYTRNEKATKRYTEALKQFSDDYEAKLEEMIPK